MKSIYYLFAMIGLLISCVSTKKYDQLAAEKRQVILEKEDLSQKMANTKSQLEAQVSAKEVEITNRQNALDRTKNEVQSLQMANKDLMRRYDELLSQNNEVFKQCIGRKIGAVRSIGRSAKGDGQKGKRIKLSGNEVEISRRKSGRTSRGCQN